MRRVSSVRGKPLAGKAKSLPALSSRWTEAQSHELCRLYKAGMPVKDIAAHFGRTTLQVHARLVREARCGRIVRRRRGVPVVPQGPKIETTSYVENGINVTVYPPRPAIGTCISKNIEDLIL